MRRAFRLVSSAVALACVATAATTAQAFLTYKQGERAKSANAAYAPAKAQVDLAALFGVSEAAKSATTLTLQLPSGKRYEVARARVLDGAEGGRTFVGYFKQYGEDYRVFVTEQQGVMTGYMLSPEGQIEIAPQVNGIAGEALVTSRTKAGLVRAFSFAPDAILTPHGQAALDRAQAFGSANSLISADQLAKATERAKAGAQVTVDVLVAYTPGMTTRLGSAAGVLSRLNTLVALMNDALTQSQVTLTMRLVNATQVNYSDVGTNTAALDAISPGSTNALKATIDGLRNQHNADIVTLVRPYQRSSHGGCGLAWILGSGSSGISASDSSYAFSAISDGSDTAGSGYFCEDVSFAHEIGHNLGLLHDRANASGTGSTNYAFGYIDASAGFGTIMSYYTGARLSRYSNPNVTCNGVPCGKPNTASDSANAAGAISAGMAVVAGFRVAAPVTAKAKRDINGDGKDDVVVKKNTGEVFVWFMNGATVTGGGQIGTVTSDWSIVAVADVNGDGKADIIWRNTAGWVAVWLLNGLNAPQGALVAQAGLEWQFAGVGDFNGDGKSDLLWRSSSGGYAMWFLNGAQISGGGNWTYAATAWSVLGVGDVNGDGRDDVILRHTSGSVVLWKTDGLAQPVGGYIGSIGPEWTSLAVGDFNLDGKADILWRSNTGYLAQWNLNDMAAPIGGIFASASSDLAIAALSDTDGNGAPDIIWRTSGGLIAHWKINGLAAPIGAWVSGLGPDWTAH